MSYQQIENWLLINPEFASLAIFAVGFFESFIIIGTFWPSIILLLLTVALNESGLSLKLIFIWASLGSFLGDFLSFYLGSYFGPKIKNKNFFLKRRAQIQKGENFFLRFGWGGIIIGRLVPAIRPFVPFVAGLAKMPLTIYVFSSFFACLIWGLALVILILGIDNILVFFK
jgi:membrane-associated protein